MAGLGRFADHKYQGLYSQDQTHVNDRIAELIKGIIPKKSEISAEMSWPNENGTIHNPIIHTYTSSPQSPKTSNPQFSNDDNNIIDHAPPSRFRPRASTVTSSHPSLPKTKAP
jgi:hypothetical protein